MPNSMNAIDVALVSLPWGPPHEPSLGLGILNARLKQEGIGSRVFHMAPQLLRWITTETYQLLADCWGVNEFLFTGELDNNLDAYQKHCLRERLGRYAAAKRHPQYRDGDSLWELVFRMRDHVIPAFLDDCTDCVLALSPRLVGFTCLFDQTMASLALAKRLKEHRHNLSVVFGGYALQGPPGETIAQAFPWIDIIVLGDGENAIAWILPVVCLWERRDPRRSNASPA